MKRYPNERQGKVIPFQSKDSRHPRLVIGENDGNAVNDLYPLPSAQKDFRIPKNMTAEQLRSVAGTISLRDIGVAIPKGCPYPDRFEAGFRHGLTSNGLNDIGHLKRSFRWGFCWAKIFFTLFFPQHPLTAKLAGGYAKMKNGLSPRDR